MKPGASAGVGEEPGQLDKKRRERRKRDDSVGVREKFRRIESKSKQNKGSTPEVTRSVKRVTLKGIGNKSKGVGRGRK